VKTRTAHAENEDLRQEMAKAVSQSEFADRKNAIEIKSVTDHLTRARLECQRLQKRLVESSPSVAALTAELTQSRRNNNTLISRLRELQKSSQEIEQLRARNEELEEQLARFDPEVLQQIKSENKFLQSVNRSLQKSADDASELREENQSLKLSVRKLALEREELSLETENSRQLIDCLDAENSMLNESQQRILSSDRSDVGSPFRAATGMRATVRQLRRSVDAIHDGETSEVLNRLSRRLQRVEAMQSSLG